MNEPIISPWVVYLITRLDAIRDFMLGVMVVGLCSPVLLPLFGAMFCDSGISAFDSLIKRWIRVLAFAIVVTGLCLALLPTAKEATMIYAASKITPQTIQAAGDSVDKAVDKVIEKILKVKEDK